MSFSLNIPQLVINYLPFFIIMTLALSILLIIYCGILSKKIVLLNQHIFSIKREIEQRENILEHSISSIAEGFPILSNPVEREKKLFSKIEQLLNRFSTTLNKKITLSIQDEQNIWHEKFSILLHTLGKNEQDIIKTRDIHFKDAWVSITELKQKSHLLFNDMKEDGIFYRLQSLWLLSNLCIIQHNHQEAFRHVTAALKICIGSTPSLPLSHKITWKIADNLIKCTEFLNHEEQIFILNKFYTTAQQITKIFEELDSIDNNLEILQRIKLWNNQHTLYTNNKLISAR